MITHGVRDRSGLDGTHIGRWNLVERTLADIEADVRAAAPPGTVAGLDITADATGLALSTTVRRADERG